MATTMQYKYCLGSRAQDLGSGVFWTLKLLCMPTGTKFCLLVDLDGHILARRQMGFGCLVLGSHERRFVKVCTSQKDDSCKNVTFDKCRPTLKPK